MSDLTPEQIQHLIVYGENPYAVKAMKQLLTKVEELERVNENHCKAHLMSIDKIDELETALAVCDVPVKRLTAKVEELQKWKDYVMENNEFYHSQEVSDADT